MAYPEEVRAFYLEHLAGAKIEGKILKAPCPFCGEAGSRRPGLMVVYLDPGSLFLGYFRCLNRCLPGGFPPYFAKIMQIVSSDWRTVRY